MTTLDLKLSQFNASIKQLARRINAEFAIGVVFLNGVLIGIATTGVLGEDSVSVFSVAGSLFLWQFLLSIIILTIHINPNSELFLKFFIAGLIGFSAQWQFFAMLIEVKDFEPIARHPFAIFLLTLSFLGGLFYCFNNQDIDDRSNRSATGNGIFRIQ